MRTGKELLVSVSLNPTLVSKYCSTGRQTEGAKVACNIERELAGSGINLAQAFHRLGGDTIATGFLGGGTGAHVQAMLDAEGLPTQFVPVLGETRSSIRIQSGGAPISYGDNGPAISERDGEALLNELKLLLPEAAWLAVGGNLPSGLSEEFLRELIFMGHRYGCKVLFDGEGRALARGVEAAPDLLKPNVAEAQSLVNRRIESMWDALDAAQLIRQMLYAAHRRRLSSYDPVVIVSHGDEGAAMACSEGAFFGHPATVAAERTSGNGASMLAGFIWAHEQGKPREECLRWGLAAGAASARSYGVEVLSRNSVLHLLANAKSSKIELRPQAAKLIAVAV